jgi:hypothetical protein
MFLKQIIKLTNCNREWTRIDVKDAWKKNGNGVNSYTKNVVLKGSTLYVELSSSVLREELSHRKNKIVNDKRRTASRCGERCGVEIRIRFQMYKKKSRLAFSGRILLDFKSYFKMAILKLNCSLPAK